MLRRFLKYIEVALKTLYLALLVLVIVFMLFFYQSFKDFFQIILKDFTK